MYRLIDDGKTIACCRYSIFLNVFLTIYHGISTATAATTTTRAAEALDWYDT
jgi:hypothetical protein